MCNKCTERAKKIKFDNIESKARALYKTATKEDMQDVNNRSAIQNAKAYLDLILQIGK